jgi:hypothetical protein
MKTISCITSVVAALTLAMLPAKAQTTYTASGNSDGSGETAFTTVVVSNNANNIFFNINTVGTESTYVEYLVGIQENGGTGGQTLINSTYGTGTTAAGNPWGNPVGISSGENFFIGSYLGYGGGAQLYQYSSVGGWSQIDTSALVGGSGTTSTTFTFSLSDLGLSVGSSFNFDVWSTYSGAESAYEALDNPNYPSGTPWSGDTYDSATADGSTFSSTIYTVEAVPEPAASALLGLGLVFAIRRVFRN